MDDIIRNEIRYNLLWIRIQIIFLRNIRKLQRNRIDYKLWKRKFLNLWKAKDERCKELIEEFLNCDISKITNHKIVRKNKYAPILFCVIKNDICKIKDFMKHYRGLGIEAFVFLDNNSKDGTQEYLCQQKDTIVYQSTEEYSSARRVAWLNRLLAIYGHNKWCLVVDSDELITFIGREKYELSSIVKKACENQYDRVAGFLVDMYPNYEMLQKEKCSNFINDFRYFDVNSYIMQSTNKGLIITGGPRRRVFHTEVYLSKYPLFLFKEKSILASSHSMVPYEPINKCPIWLAICHYKFIDKEDLKKVEEAVYKENYWGNSMDYKRYFSVISQKKGIIFFEEDNSCEMIDSYSLQNISFLKTPFKNTTDKI